MDLQALSHRAKKSHLDRPEQKMNIVQTKRRRTLSGELLDRFTPKGYPCVFLDPRLKTRLFR